MKLDEARKRLKVLDEMPKPRTRRHLPMAPGDAPRPHLAVWELTLACDHGCLHCGPRAGKARPDELSTEEALRLVDEMAEIGVGEVVLIGGEAYLRNDFILIINRVRERGMSCTLTTGGLNLNPARCRAMVEAGIQSVNVSIDGLEENHDRVRDRPGSWKKCFEALRNVKAAGAAIAVNSQFNRLNRFDHLELLELIAAEGVHSWQLQFTIPHGNAADHEICLEPYMLLEAFEQIEKVADRAEQLGVRIFPGNNLGYFGPQEQRLRKAINSAGHYKGCGAGRSVMGIESNGNIKSCPTIGGPMNTGGNWRDHGLRAIWERAPEIAYVRQRTVEDLWGYCRDCYYADVCMAGCTATSEPIMGRPGNNPYCHHRALEMDRQGLRERLERVATADPLPFANGAYRIVRESKDPAVRAEQGPVAIEEPRVSRLVEPTGVGRPLDPNADAAEYKRL